MALPKAAEVLISRYRAMRETLLGVDEMIRDVIAALSKAGKLENTVIIFTSDNGFMNGEHRLAGKSFVYEKSIRVPLIMRGPRIPTGAARRQLVNNLDVVATIVALAGATPDHALDGRDLSPIIAHDDAPWRTAMLVQGRYCGVGVGPCAYAGVRTRRYLFASHETTEQELYDLRPDVDPDQMNNFAAEPRYQLVRDELSTILSGLKACTGSGCWYDAPLQQVPGP